MRFLQSSDNLIVPMEDYILNRWTPGKINVIFPQIEASLFYNNNEFYYSA